MLHINSKLQNFIDNVLSNERWERKEMPDNFCKYCNHNQKKHERDYSEDESFCTECWLENRERINVETLAFHKFNQEPINEFSILHELIKDGSFQNSSLYAGIYTKTITDELIHEIERLFKWKIHRIESLDKKEILVWFYKTTIFCRYCFRPYLTVDERRSHEEKDGIWGCDKRPEVVTFASVGINDRRTD